MLRRQFGHVAIAVLAFSLATSASPLVVRALEGDGIPAPTLAQKWSNPFYNRGWKGAGELAVLFVPIGGGTWETTYSHASGGAEDEVSDGNYQAIMHGGLRAAGYGVLRHGFQLGGFAAADVGRMSYSIDLGGHTASAGHPVALDSSMGFAFKWGNIARRKLFVGVGLDIGLAVHHADVKNDDVRAQLGVAGSPRLLFEFPVGDKDHGAVSFALGLAASWVKGRALDSTDRITTRWLRLEPVVLLGAAFGG